VKVWITKYALTTGIFEVNGEPIQDGATIKYRRASSSSSFRSGFILPEYAHGKDFHETPELAILRANEMRVAKIASLKKQIAKLEKMTFEVKDSQS
jgi:hypothetical protein